MEWIVLQVGVLFIAVNGRNDGATIVSGALEGTRTRALPATASLCACLVIVPLLGLTHVAESLETLVGGARDDAPRAVVVLATATAVVLLSNAVRIPTSITLALVGAVTGVAVADGQASNWHLLARVLLVGLLSPLVAAGVAFVLNRHALPLAGRLGNVVRFGRLRRMTFWLLAIAYSTNDGQKVIFALALMASSDVTRAASAPAWLMAGGLVFAIGTLSGVRGRGRFLRHGVAAVTPVGLLSTELATSGAVIGGSLLGAPLSMTQCLTGGLLGVAVSRSSRAVRWGGVVRVVVSWAWTLPASAILGHVALTGLRMVL